jgi:hypothetical protein
MSYYATNHLQAPVTYREAEEQIERCEREANSYFRYATQVQDAICQQTKRDLQGLRGPKYDRARDAAKRLFKETTVEAAALYDRTLAELLETGEVSEALCDEWEALKARTEAVRNARAA